MKEVKRVKKHKKLCNYFLFATLILLPLIASAENIDPENDGSQYAWGENVGWINFEPSQGEGVTVTDSAVTGKAWGENIGWINLSPATGGVMNDGAGNLSGYAWGENVGWINFAPTGGGVTIDANGNFDGYAWGENIGWIHFQNLSVPYKVQTAWIPTTIGYSPTSFSFTATWGDSNPPDQVLNITNTGSGTLNWSVSDDATWLSLSPTSGTNSGAVTVSVDITGLTSGTYNTTITITATVAANSPVTIPVMLTINPPAVTLLKPNGGEVIPSGSMYTIQWEAQTEAVKFCLLYSKDNGTTWRLIAIGVRGKSYEWSVPTPKKSKGKCLVMVIGYDDSGMMIGEDTSDSTFTIKKKVVRVISPNGGETLTSGTTHTITWTTAPIETPVAIVKVRYTKNGGTAWRLINTLVGNPGSYDWRVPSVSTTKNQCKARVVLMDASGNIIGRDASNTYFTIQPQPPH